MKQLSEKIFLIGKYMNIIKLYEPNLREIP